MGGFGTISNIVGIQFKKKKHIMITIILANLFFCINFALLNAYSGALVCLVAMIQTLINYCFDIKNKKYPLILIISYYVVAAICAFVTYSSLIDIIPVICAMLLTTTIIQSKERNIRNLILINIILWIFYDISVGAYTAIISDVFLVTSTLIAIIRYDIKKKVK
ncbi:hypothetical protein AGMMS50249_5530 [candidate division SR1 bacterium]|nr:hypothetical protein AGMMS50249_5530 [candidate division SR1 bacterium]